MRHHWPVEGHQTPPGLRGGRVAGVEAEQEEDCVRSTSRVLLVEDDQGYSYALVRRLQEAGVEVVAVSTGFAALLLIESSSRFDLLVLDIRLGLGQPDGVAIARTVRLKRSTKIIFLTGYDHVASAESLGPLVLKAGGVEEASEAILMELATP